MAVTGGSVTAPPWRVALAVAVGFYAALACVFDSTLAGRPFAVVRGGRVFDLSPELAARGVSPGIKRSNLLELCPEARLVPYEPDRFAEGQERLLDIYARHVPAVEPLDTTQTFLDVAGLDPAVCARIGREARHKLGVTVGFGLGPTKLVARAAGLELARRGVARPGEILAVPAAPAGGGNGSELQAFLDPLPVAYLYPLPADVPPRLERLGFRNIGEVRGLPVGELARHFGWPLARRIAVAAGGGEADPVRPAWPLPSLQATRRFEGGLVDREALERAVGEVAGLFSREMTDRGLASGEVGLVFRGEGGRRAEATRRLTRPARSRATLRYAFLGLAGRLLEGWGEGDPPVEMEARAARVLPRAGEQLDFEWLFGRGCGAGPSRDEVRELVQELAGRFGAAGEEAYSRSRRESLLAFYDPLRAGARPDV